MTPDQRIIGESEPKSNFQEKLRLLSNPPESARPIESITDEDVAELREILEKAGFNLDLSSEGLQSLRHKQFRSLEQGKGPAIVESLGQKRAQELFDKCEEIAVSYKPRPIFADKGLKHTIGSFVALAVLPADHRPRIIQNLNQRVYLGYNKTQREVAREAFAKVPPVSEPSKKATVPVGSINRLWEAMTSK